MVYSNERKLALSGWLMENENEAYKSPLKLQKFLLLYEAFSKVDNDNADFSYLKGYQKGPVFSNVWGDYTHDRAEFDLAASQAYKKSPEYVNTERAKIGRFIVNTLTETELSELTHKMNLWKKKETRIMSGEQQVPLNEADFNAEDTQMVKLLEQMYPLTMIDNSVIIRIDSHYFVFSKTDYAKLAESHLDTLSLLSNTQELVNPVFVELDEEGRLLVD